MSSLTCFAMCVTYLSCTITLYSTITTLARVKSWLPPIRYTTVNCVTLCALVASGTVLRPVLVGTSYSSGVQSSQMKSCFIVFGLKQISNFAMPCDHKSI